MNHRTEASSATTLPASAQAFLEDVLAGLGDEQKRIPSKYFYDRHGSELFDEICELEEYYPTRTELGIMQANGEDMARQIGPGVMLVEYGSGSSVKTRILLDRLENPTAYVPVDISCDHLHRTAKHLAAIYPLLEILPICADFTGEFALPTSRRRATHSAVYFPGSTIGNFQPAAARKILRRIAPLCGDGGGLLIGIDLQKDIQTLEAAYDDREGVTAEFNLNVLRRINRELEGTFVLEAFEHLAFYNEEYNRIEMHLVSRCEQSVSVRNQPFQFAEGESILTEYSHKYTVDGFAAEAAKAGLSLHKAWTDDRQLFAVLHLAVLD